MLQQKSWRRGDYGVLILAPTWELAYQIETELEKLLSFTHNLRVKTLTGAAVGNPEKEYKRIQDCEILIAAPGRLLKILNNGDYFATQFQNLKVMVLDEVDTLLDSGFRNDIKFIFELIDHRGAGTRKRKLEAELLAKAAKEHLGSESPDLDSIKGNSESLATDGLNKSTAHRKTVVAAKKPKPVYDVQTLFFSATIPKKLKQLSNSGLAPGYTFIDTVPQGGVLTHDDVPQEMLVTRMNRQHAALHALLKQHIDKQPGYKIIVFCPTTMICEALSTIATRSGLQNVSTIHSKKTMTTRANISGSFRDSSSSILFTSDVSARGVDYPGRELLASTLAILNCFVISSDQLTSKNYTNFSNYIFGCLPILLSRCHSCDSVWVNLTGSVCASTGSYR